jgi:DNA-binding SARP family transcriptional activator
LRLPWRNLGGYEDPYLRAPHRGDRRAQDRRGTPGRQGRLLFAYLVLNRLRPATRAELIEALWPEHTPANPDSALSALLSKLRRLVELEGRSEVRLVLPDDAWVDVEAASEGIHFAESALVRGEPAAAYGPARIAQHVGGRSFLRGEEAPWIEELRRRLEGIYLRSLELVAQASLEIGGSEIDTAGRTARSLIAAAPYRESGYRFLMEVLDAQGNRAEALRLYEQLRVLLREELGASPSQATQDVHRRLLA